MRIRTRLLLICIPLVVAPVLLVGYLTFRHNEHLARDALALSRNIYALQNATELTAREVFDLLERRSRSDYDFLLLQVQSGIQLTLRSLRRLADTLAASTLVATFMNASPQARPLAAQQVETLFFETLRNYTLSELALLDMQGCELLRLAQDLARPDGDDFDALPMGNQTEDETDSAWFQARLKDLSPSASTSVYFDPDFPAGPTPVLCLSLWLDYFAERYSPEQGARLGLLKLTIPLREVLRSAMLRATDMPATIFLTDTGNRMLAHPDPAKVGKLFKEVYPDTAPYFLSSRVVVSGQILLWVLASKEEFRRNVEFVNQLSDSLRTQASFSRSVAESLQRNLGMLRLRTFYVALLTLAVAVPLVVLMVRKLTAPLARLAKSARRIADGALDDSLAIPRGLPLEMERLWTALELMRTNLKDHIDNLDRRVAARTRELSESNSQLLEAKEEIERAYEKLKELDAVKTEFLSTVSHELRTPLTSISGFAVMIQARLHDTVLPQLNLEHAGLERALKRIVRDIGIIVTESERLAELIADLLDIARLESGKATWHDQSVKIEDVIAHAAASVSSLFEEKGLLLKTEVEPGLPLIVVDQGRLVQVLINLLGNAQKFTSEGEVICQARRVGENLEISVRDTGPGIALKDQEAIFERFRQVGSAEAGKPRGSGLGLPICREILAHYGGSLRVESESGQGSRFICTLPLGPKVLPGGARPAV